MKKLYFLFITLFTTAINFAQPANDDCSNPEMLTVTTTNTSVTFDINTATINNEVGCAGTTAADYADVWYEFIMPFNGNVYVDGDLSWNRFALYNTCGGTEIDCGDSNKFFTNLTSGNIYFLRVFRTSSTASNTSYQSFDIKAFEEVTNDDCNSSENITVTTTSSTIDFSIGGANLNNQEGCTGTTNDYVDIWYDFNMPFNGNVYIDANINWNILALYDSCTGTQIQCGTGNQFFTGLSSGTNYKIRVFRTENNADNNYTSFSIKAFEEVINDDCNSSENITVTTTSSTIDFSIGGANLNNQEGCTGTTNDYVDIWYDFNMPFNGNVYIDANINWNILALYDSCTGTQIQCGTGNQFFTGLSSGTNYKIRVFRTENNADNNYTSFSIKAFEEVTNDDCNSSENITVTTTSSTIDFNIGGASINDEVGCSGTSSQEYADIWYDFTMPVNGNLHVNGTIGWNNFALYNACSGAEIQCGNDNELISGLTTGTNYKLRVFRTRAHADNNYTSFTIQAFEIINNDDCASADNITVTNTSTEVNFGIAGATVNNEVGCSGTTAQDYVDIWYEFTMPIDGFIVINGTIGWNNFALYDNCAGTELGCFNDSGDFGGLTSGTTYKLRVFRTLAHADNNTYKSFTIYSTETLSLNNITLENTIKIYPNPVKDFLNISSTENETIKSISLFNMLGKKVLTTKTKNIDVSNYQSGIYLIKISTEKSQVTKKIVIN